MSLTNQSTRQTFPFSFDQVFSAFEIVAPNCGFKMKSADRIIGRITVTTGMSLFSYGEHITILLDRAGEDATSVEIESSLKVGSNIAGGHRHAKNFEKLISGVSRWLQT